MSNNQNLSLNKNFEVNYPKTVNENAHLNHNEESKTTIKRKSENNFIVIGDKQDMQLELSWNNLSLTATVEEGNFCNKKSHEKKILENVSGSLLTGSSLAILGASGAGKTTLLNYLSRKIENSSLKATGNVTLNGEELSSDDFSAITSYVMQDDMLEPVLTPREILMFTALLKLKSSRIEIEERVAYLLKILRIEKCQNTRIGDNLERGVSGGERKRTSIAVELLSDSPIVFLDEPTTGLDSYNAFEVIHTINDLCLENKMIIFTIHQPASEIFELLSKICILALGKVVYFGSSNNIHKYFETLKLPIPTNYNPFEYFIEITNISIVNDPKVLETYPEINLIEDNQEKYKSLVSIMNSHYEANFKHEAENKFSGISSQMKELINDKQISQGFFYQLMILYMRLTIINLRNKKVLIAKVMQFLIIGVIIALVFNNLRLDLIGIQDRRGLLIMITMLSVFLSTTTAILVCKFAYCFILITLSNVTLFSC